MLYTPKTKDFFKFVSWKPVQNFSSFKAIFNKHHILYTKWEPIPAAPGPLWQSTLYKCLNLYITYYKFIFN